MAPETGVREVEQEQGGEPMISVYYLRHGESSEDKTDPLRGLTEKGKQQVLEAVDQISSEFTDPKQQIRLYSSGSERTQQQTMVAAWLLHQKGFTNLVVEQSSLPQKELSVTEDGISFGAKRDHEWSDDEKKALLPSLGIRVIEGSGGVKGRIGELKAPKEYMASLRASEAETGVPAVVKWLTDTEFPQGAESPDDKVRVLDEAITQADRIAGKLKEKNAEPFTAFVFGHSSALTAYAQEKLGFDPLQHGEVENAEGISLKLSGDGKPVLSPLGPEIEKVA